MYRHRTLVFIVHYASNIDTNVYGELCTPIPSGHEYMVSAGSTLLLPCNSSFKLRQRWLHWREGGKREVIFTRFRNGTTKPESDARRFSYKNDALQILDLQPQDAGQYQCNGNLRTRVSVWNGKFIYCLSSQNSTDLI